MLPPRSPQIASIYRELESEAREAFRDEGARPTLTRSADLRYHGQGFELSIDWAADAVTRFHRLHAQSYGYSDPARTVGIVTLRVRATAKTRKPHQLRLPIVRGNGQHARIASHRIFERGHWRRAALYDRSLLHPGDRILGPAIVVELSATTYLPTAWSATVDAFGNLILALTTKAGGRA